MFLALVRFGTAGYLIVLAIAAAIGIHRALLAYPVKVTYAAARLAVYALSFGHVQLAPLARRTRRRQARRIRNLRFTISEWRRQQAEEKALAAGLSLAEQGKWTQASPEHPVFSVGSEASRRAQADAARKPEPRDELPDLPPSELL